MGSPSNALSAIMVLINPVVWSSSAPTCKTLPSLVVVRVAGTMTLVAKSFSGGLGNRSGA
jgi:hypothetical protein